MSDFDGTPLVAGSIRGIRAWKWRGAGGLHSPTQAFFWMSGENEAECRNADKFEELYTAESDVVRQVFLNCFLPEGAQIRKMTSAASLKNPKLFVIGVKFFVPDTRINHPMTYTGLTGRIPEKVRYVEGGYVASIAVDWRLVTEHLERTPIPHDHNACGCGFYAYTDITQERSGLGYLGSQHNVPISRAGGVAGVIEGYGVVSMGPYGFRASKAKIVALCLPEFEELTRFSDLYPDVFFFDNVVEMLDEFPLGVQHLSL